LIWIILGFPILLTRSSTRLLSLQQITCDKWPLVDYTHVCSKHINFFLELIKKCYFLYLIHEIVRWSQRTKYKYKLAMKPLFYLIITEVISYYANNNRSHQKTDSRLDCYEIHWSGIPTSIFKETEIIDFLKQKFMELWFFLKNGKMRFS